MNTKTARKRLDMAMVERGLADTRQKALAMILAGEVQVNGIRAEKAGLAIAEDSRIDVNSRLQKYASRAGLKLEGALADFAINVTGYVCLDIGASNGGFTDCLLQHGAARVYAVDVNVNQMAWKLQQDSRVIRVKRNARQLLSSEISESVDIVTVDVSFISVAKVLGPAAACAKSDAQFLVLVKPQFELRREEIGPGGIVKDQKLHEKAIASVRAAADTAGLNCLHVQASRLAGTEGNQEYFLRAQKKAVQ